MPRKADKSGREAALTSTVIHSVDGGSPAARAGIRPGDTLLLINGHMIHDVLDYRYHSYDSRLELVLRSREGKTRKLRLRKREGADLGLEFDTYLMDKARSCANHCLFCFVDQLPPGMRETLYFKDDDARLSFLMGNYITLTNLSDREAQRIIDLHISPINVSVHSTDPELRSLLLGFRNGGRGLELMRRFAENGITMNCQIVLCPGLNDGAELERSMTDLAAMHPGVGSVSIVPVGLTKYREGLYPLRPFDRESAGAVLRLVTEFGDLCLEKYGTRIFFCADELYLKAHEPLPAEEYYEDYPQLENGVGLLRLLDAEFTAALAGAPADAALRPCSIATGMAAAPFLNGLIDRAAERCHTIDCPVYAIENDFFGHTIDVAGLVTGGDLIAQLRGRPLGERLLLPSVMLRHGENVFLDDVTPEQVSQVLGVPVQPVSREGEALVRAIWESGE